MFGANQAAFNPDAHQRCGQSGRPIPLEQSADAEQGEEECQADDEGVPQIGGIASDPLTGAFRKVQSGRRAEDVPVANQQSC